MKVKSNLGYINKLFDNFEVIFRKKIEVVNPVVVENEKKYIIFYLLAILQSELMFIKRQPMIIQKHSIMFARKRLILL